MLRLRMKLHMQNGLVITDVFGFVTCSSQSFEAAAAAVFGQHLIERVIAIPVAL